MSQLLDIEQAAEWASDYLKRDVSASNITYLVQYGKVRKLSNNGSPAISLDDLEKYYNSRHHSRVLDWKQKLGNDLNWALSFDNLREIDTTKHVHRLHPYKGKYIPQLVQYFFDEHTDEFKTKTYFKKGDIILDPFQGSGTTSVQANEFGLHSIGIDVSRFNCLIAECKLHKYDIKHLSNTIHELLSTFATLQTNRNIASFDNELSEELYTFNNTNFPSPQFKTSYNSNEILNSYIKEEEQEFLKTYDRLVKKHGVQIAQPNQNTFLDKWYTQNTRDEMEQLFDLIKKESDKIIKKLLALILSRTIRSCRATTHSDLATLKSAQLTTYYCYKHFKICKPIFSIKSMFNKYALDTINRIKTFEPLRTDAHTAIIASDSRIVNIQEAVAKTNQPFATKLAQDKIKGIFTSPPYVGQIDYHEQHAYAYDLFGFERHDELEIGPLYSGQGAAARESYTNGITDVLINCLKYMVAEPEIFLVANDKYNLYPQIAEQSGLKIVNQFKRPVLNRTERDKSPYSEIIFHMQRT